MKFRGYNWTDYSSQVNLKHSQLQYMNCEIDHNVTRPTLVVFTMEFSLKRVARLETIFRFSSHESHSRSLSLLITAKRAENFHKWRFCLKFVSTVRHISNRKLTSNNWQYSAQKIANAVTVHGAKPKREMFESFERTWQKSIVGQQH